MQVRIRHDDRLRLERAVRPRARVGDEPGRGLGGDHGPHREHHLPLPDLATNAGGTGKGSDETFKTLPNAPTVVTKAGVGDHADLGDAQRHGQPQRRRSRRMQASNTARRTPTARARPAPRAGVGHKPGRGVGVAHRPQPRTPPTTSASRRRTPAARAKAQMKRSKRSSCTAEGFCASFTHSETIEGPFREPEAVAVDPSGNIWVADSGHDQGDRVQLQTRIPQTVRL